MSHMPSSSRSAWSTRPPADWQLRASFNLPSTAHTFWVNVLFYPDDALNARIMFKRHVCDDRE